MQQAAAMGIDVDPAVLADGPELAPPASKRKHRVSREAGDADRAKPPTKRARAADTGPRTVDDGEGPSVGRSRAELAARVRAVVGATRQELAEALAAPLLPRATSRLYPTANVGGTVPRPLQAATLSSPAAPQPTALEVARQGKRHAHHRP
jgi:hypothetical protein